MKSSIDKNILARYFAEEADSNELSIINNWLEEDDNNLKILKDYQMIWVASDLRTSSFTPNIDLAWEKVAKQTATKKRTFYLLSIAAGITAILLLGTYLMITQLQSTDYLSLKSEKASAIKVLADGSSVNLNSFSLLEFPENFNGNDRRVKLIGEAYFDIKENPDKPFIIEVNGTEIRVLGTSFNISARDQNVKVSVNSGTVSFVKGDIQEVVLEKGEEAVYESLRDTIKTSPILDRNVFAHKTKIFEFKDSPIEVVIKTLNKGYQTNIRLQGDEWANYILTTSFENQNLSDALEIIAQTLEIDLQMEGKTYVFAKIIPEE